MSKETFSQLYQKLKEVEPDVPIELKNLLDSALQRCSNYLQQPDTPSAVAVREYAQAVFDFTYIDENRLVEESFPEKSSRERIQNIFDWLDGIEIEAKALTGDKEVIDVLEEEIVECLMWRRGALLYMYCSTLQEDPQKLQKCAQHYVDKLKAGVEYLQKVLTTRKPLDIGPSETGDKDVQTLLRMGMYSDTHLLTMMYAGEMCYWYSVMEKKNKTASSGPLEAKEIGVKMLSGYLTAIKEPMLAHGWSSDRAEELLQYFNT